MAGLSGPGEKTGILLVRSNSVPTVVDDYIWDNAKKQEDIDQLFILGGESAVSLKNAVALYKLLP